MNVSLAPEAWLSNILLIHFEYANQVTSTTPETVLAVALTVTLAFATIHIVITLLDFIIAAVTDLDCLLLVFAMEALEWMSFRASRSETLASVLTEPFSLCNLVSSSLSSNPRIVADFLFK